MSIGNLKDSGNQGNNFPWQLKMLLGQQCACDQLTTLVANTDDVEFLLTAILTTLQASTEYEAKFVVDTCDSDKVYLEVRVWNPDTSTWGPITYYLPGSDTPVTPVGEGTPGCLQYTDPSGVLALILGAIQAGNLILTDIEADTTSIDATLTNLFAAYSAGPQACADSLSVTLCTEQGTTLSGILTELQGILDVNITNATLAVTQSGAWTVTSNQGTSPWVVSGTVALDAATLAALETITVLQGTTPWTVNGTVNAAQSGSWTVALDAATLAALETITVQQGTSPWVVSGTVGLDAATLTALENITVQNGPGAAAVNIQDGGNSITVDANNLDIRDLSCATDSVAICSDGTPVGTANPLPVNIAGGVTLEVNLDQNNDQVQVYGSDLTAPIATDASGHLQVDILTIPEVEIKNDVGNPIPVSDAGGSLTVDGTVALDAPTLAALENITVQNGAGAAAVNIQDGGNSITVDDGGGSITVDGTVTANQGTSPWVVSGTVTATPTGTQDVNIISTIALPVTDNGGSLTVDANNLDIRDLAFATDKVDVSNSTNVAVTDGGGSLTVDGTVNIGNFPASIEISNDAGNPLPVSGTVTITDGSGPITVDGTVAATQSGTWNINNITGTVSLPTGAATETTLAAVNTKLTPTTRTHNTVSATGAGSVPAGSLRGSVLNVGSAAGTWNGISLPAGVAIPWDAVGPRDTYGAIAYNATGTTFIIEYTT